MCVVVGWWVKGLDDKNIMILFFLLVHRPLEKEKPHLGKMENPGLQVGWNDFTGLCNISLGEALNVFYV